jgi:hypothetical protein
VTNPRHQLRLENHSTEIGSNRWSWIVWLDGPPAVLDQVRQVTYYLHPTFPKPVVLRRNRKNRFLLNGSGWGEFEIRAEVDVGGDETIPLSHWLQFDRPAEPRSARETKAAVYVSHTASDGPIASSLCYQLLERGLDPIAVPYSHGRDLSETVIENVERADVIVVLTSDSVSDWGLREATQAVNTCRSQNKPLIPVVIGDSPVPESLMEFQQYRLKNASDLDGLVEHIAAVANKR